MKNKLMTILVVALAASIACNIIQGIYTEKNNLNQQQVAEYITQKEIYWTLAVEDYLISLQKGETEDTLDLVYSDEEKEMHLLSFEKEKDYIEPADISAEVFENCLGHNGFILYKRYSLGRYVHYYEAEYYAVDEELEFLAYRWGSRDDNFYEVDVDGDSINELICNVTWLADGGEDVYIYHFDGEKVMKAFGSDLLDQPFDNHGLGAMYTTYLPDIGKVHIKYWQDALDGYAETDYDIDLDKLELYETFK